MGLARQRTIGRHFVIHSCLAAPSGFGMEAEGAGALCSGSWIVRP